MRLYIGDAFEWASHVSSGYSEILRTLLVAATIFWSAVSGMFFAQRYGKPVGWAVGLVSFALLFYIRQPLMYGFKLAECEGLAGDGFEDCMYAVTENPSSD